MPFVTYLDLHKNLLKRNAEQYTFDYSLNGTPLWLFSKGMRIGCLKWHPRVLLPSEAEYRGIYLVCKISFHFRMSAWHCGYQWGLLEGQKCKMKGEHDCLQLSLWACSSVHFPFGSQFSSFLLYLLQNMDDNCFLTKTISLKIVPYSINLSVMRSCRHIWWSTLAAFANVLLVCFKHKTATKKVKMFSFSPFSCFMREVPDTK